MQKEGGGRAFAPCGMKTGCLLYVSLCTHWLPAFYSHCLLPGSLYAHLYSPNMVCLKYFLVLFSARQTLLRDSAFYRLLSPSLCVWKAGGQTHGCFQAYPSVMHAAEQTIPWLLAPYSFQVPADASFYHSYLLFACSLLALPASCPAIACVFLPSMPMLGQDKDRRRLEGLAP